MLSTQRHLLLNCAPCIEYKILIGSLLNKIKGCFELMKITKTPQWLAYYSCYFIYIKKQPMNKNKN